MENRHIVYFDWLRLLSALAVVAIHVTAPLVGQPWMYGAYAWNAGNVFNALSRPAVPVFLMISGALFLGREIPVGRLYKKYILRLALAFLFWSAVYALLLPAPENPETPPELLFRLLSGHSRFSFLLYLAGLYMLTPCLRALAREDALRRYFLLLCLLFQGLLPMLCELAGLCPLPAVAKSGEWLAGMLKRMAVSLPLGYSGYFVLGYHLHTAELTPRRKALLCAAGVLGAAVTVWGTRLLWQRSGSFSELFYSYLSANVAAQAVGLFVFAESVLARVPLGPRGRKALQILAGGCFGVYMLHTPVLELLLGKLMDYDTMAYNVLLAIPVRTLAAFGISLAAALLLKKLPLLGRWLL